MKAIALRGLTGFWKVKDRPWLILLAVLIAVLNYSCGKSHEVSAPKPTISSARASAFSLKPVEGKIGEMVGPFLSSIEISTEVGAESIKVSAVFGNNANHPPLNRIAVDLLYDGQNLKPISFDVGEAWGGDDKVVSLAYLNSPDSVPIAISYTRDFAGHCANPGVLFSVTFVPANASSSRVVASPPSDAVNHISRSEITVDTSGIGTGQGVSFIWKEKNLGDYDRSGKVDIADIFPLADYWGYTTATHPEIMEVVDGDESGKIDIMDVFPIADNFFRKIEGYRVWRSGMAPEDYLPNLDNPSDSEVSASRPDPESAPPGRLEYRYTDNDPIVEPSVFYRLYAYADGEVGARSDDIYPFGQAPDQTPPAWQGAPGIQSASPGNGKVLIGWTPAVDTESPPVTYLLYWAESSLGINWNTPQQQIPEGTTSFLVEGLTNDVEYVFGVRAKDSASPPNVTTNTNTLTATPSASAVDTMPPIWQGPEGIQSAIAGDGQVTISWTSAVDEDSPPVVYMLYWAESSAGIDWESAPQREISEGSTSSVITGLANGVDYVFGVRARDSASPPNVTSNTNTITVTVGPSSPHPFGIPPKGISQPGHLGNEVAVDALGTATFFVSVENELTGIKWFYYDETAHEWVTGMVDPSMHRFYHPDLVVSPIGIFVSAFDIQTKNLIFFSSADGLNWTAEVIAGGFRDCQAISMKYSEPLGRLAIAAVFQRDVGANEELDYFTKGIDETTWTQVVLDNTDKVIYWTDLEFTPDGRVAITYSKGDIDNQVVNTFLYYGEGDPVSGAFSSTRLTNTPKCSYMDLEFSPSGEPVIAFTNSRVITFLGTDVPLTDMYVARFNGTGWDYSILEEGFAETDFSTYVKIVLTGADPTLEFYPDGTAILIWSYIDVTETSVGETIIDVDTKRAQLTAGTWDKPELIFEGGSSANHLRVVNGVYPVATWVVPEIDPENPPQRNDFPNGAIVVWRPPY